jgi:hypothetical protein
MIDNTEDIDFIHKYCTDSEDEYKHLACVKFVKERDIVICKLNKGSKLIRVLNLDKEISPDDAYNSRHKVFNIEPLWFSDVKTTTKRFCANNCY